MIPRRSGACHYVYGEMRQFALLNEIALCAFGAFLVLAFPDSSPWIDALN